MTTMTTTTYYTLSSLRATHGHSDALDTADHPSGVIPQDDNRTGILPFRILALIRV
jgi:hypothetical protein